MQYSYIDNTVAVHDHGYDFIIVDVKNLLDSDKDMVKKDNILLFKLNNNILGVNTKRLGQKTIERISNLATIKLHIVLQNGTSKKITLKRI